MRGFDTKVILKKTFWNNLPREVQRRDKQGFSIPIKNWIRNELRPMMIDLLNENRIKQQDFFCAEYITKLVDEHLKGVENHSHKLWALMVFEMWYELYGKG
jgi:asparagine synthase (glutamine-hydrolysing)